LTETLTPTKTEQTPLVSGGVGRRPLYLESQGQALFAWLHRRADAPCRGGIVLCPPIGCEQIHAHRTLRHLADTLAEAGHTVLRFDYVGTGDSAGGDGEQSIAAWTANVVDAARWLENLVGGPVSLLGVRLGAALAMAAAAVQPVENLVLWGPVIKGRHLLRELTLLSAAIENASPPQPDADLEAAGFVYPRRLCDEIAKIDLLTEAPRCRRALIVARDDVAPDKRLHEQFTNQGIAAEQVSTSGFAAMLAEPHESRIPVETIAQIAEWLDRAPSTVMVSAAAPNIAPPRMPERPVIVPPLFGVVSESNDESAADLPTIVLLNAGAAYHVGPNRLHVELARALATEGFRSVRVDLSGLGDSAVRESPYENEIYAPTALRDIEQLLHDLEEQLGTKRFILMGLCSGAYHAWKTASELEHPGLVESILINPLTFHWREGMSLDDFRVQRTVVDNYYDNILYDPRKWWKLVTGQSRTGLLGAVRVGLGRMFRGNSAGTGRAEVPAALNRIRDAGRRVAFFFSKSDPGYRLLMTEGKRTVMKSMRTGELTMSFIEDADHTFSLAKWRRQLTDEIVTHLVDRYRQGVHAKARISPNSRPSLVHEAPPSVER
jgi:pimeloyl-ACP methyl ester carboxylesterase